MKRICIYLVVLLSVATTSSVTAQDAATEVKEGDVEHWIEYYKKERGLSNEAVTDDEATPEGAPQPADDKGHGSSSTRPDTPYPDD